MYDNWFLYVLGAYWRLFCALDIGLLLHVFLCILLYDSRILQNLLQFCRNYMYFESEIVLSIHPIGI